MRAVDYVKPEDWEKASRDLATFNNNMTADEAMERIMSSMNIEADLIKHWLYIRANAIEIGILAERNLIAAGHMTDGDRRILSRNEARQQSHNGQVDEQRHVMIR